MAFLAKADKDGVKHIFTPLRLRASKTAEAIYNTINIFVQRKLVEILNDPDSWSNLVYKIFWDP